MSPQRWYLEHAWLPEREDSAVHSNVLVEVSQGRFTRVSPGADESLRAGATYVEGLTLGGFANAHSHAFHRALRGHTQTERGTFWTWREQMYDLARRLTPESYFQLAQAVFAELVSVGWTTVGEFHYLHHDPVGQRYGSHDMEEALVAAAALAGIRITLLDTAYLSSGFGTPPQGVQVRYSDGTADAWCERVADLRGRVDAYPHARLGAAIHSVRALAPQQIATVARFTTENALVLHAHLSEQRAENLDCLAAYGTTPTQLLNDHGALGSRTSLVHATHLADRDVALIGAARSYACFCPTTERDLGDGIGPSRALAAAGAKLTVGSDSHAVVDPFEELRAVELDERLASQSRGHWSAAELLTAGTREGHASLGWADVGAIAVGQRADLVTLDLASPRTAGGGPSAENLVFAAAGADVRQVVIDGRVVFSGDTASVGAALQETIESLRRDRP